jgi:hypothetical protein
MRACPNPHHLRYNTLESTVQFNFQMLQIAYYVSTLNTPYLTIGRQRALAPPSSLNYDPHGDGYTNPGLPSQTKILRPPQFGLPGQNMLFTEPGPPSHRWALKSLHMPTLPFSLPGQNVITYTYPGPPYRWASKSPNMPTLSFSLPGQHVITYTYPGPPSHR